MKLTRKQEFMKGVPSAIQAILFAFSTILILLVFGDFLRPIPFFSKSFGEPVICVSQAVLIATGCYYICKQNPLSVWYVPIIANVVVIISVLVGPNFWVIPLGVYFGSSIILSVSAGALGALKGRNVAKLHS